jgi:hypothetical protein
LALTFLSRKADSGLGNIRSSPGDPVRNVDWILLITQGVLTVMGCLVVYSASRTRIVNDPFAFVTRQVVFAIIACVVMVFVMMVDYEWFKAHAAFLYGPEADDIRAVLAFANVELLETRDLDAQLDVALDQAYAALSRRSERRRLLPGAASVDLQRIAQMQVENAMLFEGVNNALKLLGDQYLARVYRLASQRFHLAEWDASILRKLHTLDSIYTKLADRATHRRMETLAWIVIVLIAVEILLPFLIRMPPH